MNRKTFEEAQKGPARLSEFLRTCSWHGEAGSTTSEVTAAFNRWANSQGHVGLTVRTMHKTLRALVGPPRRSHRGTTWDGLVVP